MSNVTYQVKYFVTSEADEKASLGSIHCGLYDLTDDPFLGKEWPVPGAAVCVGRCAHQGGQAPVCAGPRNLVLLLRSNAHRA